MILAMEIEIKPIKTDHKPDPKQTCCKQARVKHIWVWPVYDRPKIPHY